MAPVRGVPSMAANAAFTMVLTATAMAVTASLAVGFLAGLPAAFKPDQQADRQRHGEAFEKLQFRH